MPSATREMREQLFANDPDFRRLAEEHSRYEAQLEQLSSDPYLCAEDLVYQMTLKKLKLRVKDEMEALLAQRRRQQ